MNNVLNNYLLICISANGFSICISVFITGIILCFLCLLGIKKNLKNKDDVDEEADADENNYIRKYLDLYLKKDKPGFAVFLNGPWGSGKTFFVKKYKTNIKNKIYVSLFGVANKNEFEFRLWKGMIFDSSNIVLRTIIPFVLTILFIVLCICYWGDDISKFLVINFPYHATFILTLCKEIIAICSLSIIVVIILYVWKYIRFKAMERLLNNCFLVIDDFERVEASCDKVLAWINEFVEHINCPVIIIGNEDAIFDNLKLKHKEDPDEDVKHYNTIKEKTIGKEFFFTQTDEKVCKKLIMGLDSSSDLRKTLENNMEWFIKIVLNPLKNDPYKHQTNYRVLASCFSEFDYYFNKNIIDKKEDWEKFIAADKYWKELIVKFFSFMYLKKIHQISLMKSDISSISTENNTDEIDLEYSDTFAERIFDGDAFMENDKVSDKFFELYPSWKASSSLIYFPEIWIEINRSNSIPKGYYSMLFDFVNNPIIVSSAGSVINRWLNVNNLDDNEYFILLDDTDKEFEKPSLTTFSNVVRFIQSIYVAFEKGYVKMKWNESELKNKLFMYIEKVYDNKQFQSSVPKVLPYEMQIERIENIFNKQIKSRSLSYALKNKLCEVIENKIKEESVHKYNSLIEQIKSNSKTFENWYTEDNRIKMDYFSGQKPEELWLVLRDLSTRDFRIILNLFNKHITFAKYDEFEFWEEIINLAKTELQLWRSKNKNIWKCDCLDWFCEKNKELLNIYKEKLRNQPDKEDFPNEGEMM